MTNSAQLNIEIEEENDFSMRMYQVNPSTGLPIDLTGYRAEMQVRSGYDGASNVLAPVLIYTSELNKGIVLGSTSGTVDLFISYKDLVGLPWTQGVYSMSLITPTGFRTTFVKGFFTINANVTRLVNSSLPNDVIGTPSHPNNLGIGGTDGS